MFKFAFYMFLWYIIFIMNMEKFDYHFRIRNNYDVALNLASIYKDVAYSQFDKTQLDNIFKTSRQDISKNNYVQHFSNIIKDLNDKCNKELSQTIDYLNQRWQNYKQRYYEIVGQIFNIEFNFDVVNNLYCELQYLPINEISVKDGAIYLSCNQSNEQIFVKFIIKLTQLILLQTWNNYNRWKFNTDFDSQNKIFMFADIAVDAIFHNSELNQVCDNPSYKYFYNINYQNVNMMKQFREMYKSMEINKFLDEVYLFVYNNYSSLSQFKHYLY